MSDKNPPPIDVTITTEQVTSRIFAVRGMQVLMDSHLAEMYGVETKAINRAVKRNTSRFPQGFYFQLSAEEWAELQQQLGAVDAPGALRYQSGTLETPGRGRHRKYLPHVFTEQGVAMLSAVLHSETAINVSVRIMEAFVEMRRFFLQNASLFQKVEQIEIRQLRHIADTDEKFNRVFNALDTEKEPLQGIFFNGQIFDAYAFVAKLIKSAKKSIVLIDNYIDETVLALLSKRSKGVSATIFTRKITQTLALDLERYNAQYQPIQIKVLPQWHDRFLLIDDTVLYHVGASLKDLGRQCFAFSRLDSLAPEISHLITTP